MRLRRVPPPFPRLHPTSLHRRRDPRASPAFPAQCTFPRPADARRARCDPRRDARCVEPRLARALPLSINPSGMNTFVAASLLLHQSPPAQTGGGGSGLILLIELVALLGIFYWWRIPAQKQRQRHE